MSCICNTNTAHDALRLFGSLPNPDQIFYINQQNGSQSSSCVENSAGCHFPQQVFLKKINYLNLIWGALENLWGKKIMDTLIPISTYPLASLDQKVHWKYVYSIDSLCWEVDSFTGKEDDPEFNPIPIKGGLNRLY